MSDEKVVKRKTPAEEYEERDKLLNDMLVNINKVSKELAMVRPYFRKELQEKLDRLTFNYNSFIEKRSKNRMRGLRDNTPMNKEEIYRLIDSV